MKYDVLMFVAMLTTLAASGVHALQPQPMSERIAVLERDYEHMSTAVDEVRREFRRHTEEIKELLREQNDQTEKWIVIVLGLLITGDRGWAILQRVKNNRKERI